MLRPRPCGRANWCHALAGKEARAPATSPVWAPWQFALSFFTLPLRSSNGSSPPGKILDFFLFRLWAVLGPDHVGCLSDWSDHTSVSAYFFAASTLSQKNWPIRHWHEKPGLQAVHRHHRQQLNTLHHSVLDCRERQQWMCSWTTRLCCVRQLLSEFCIMG